MLYFNNRVRIKVKKSNIGKEIKNLIPKALPKYNIKLEELLAIFLFIVGMIPKFVKTPINPTIDNPIAYCPRDSAPKFLASKIER
jgi:hypothetical protein